MNQNTDPTIGIIPGTPQPSDNLQPETEKKATMTPMTIENTKEMEEAIKQVAKAMDSQLAFFKEQEKKKKEGEEERRKIRKSNPPIYSKDSRVKDQSFTY